MDFHVEVPDPEEVRKQFEEAQVRHQMMVANLQHEVQRLFKELSEEQLVTLRFLFNSCASVGPIASSYYEGLTTASLIHRYDWCACGEKHDPDAPLLHQTASQEPAPDPDVPPVLVDPAAMSTPPPLEADDLPPVPTGVNPTFLDFNEVLHQMEEYGVEPAPDSATGTLQCTGCGQMYPSLEDRMLRRDCPGCVEKAKWG